MIWLLNKNRFSSVSPAARFGSTIVTPFKDVLLVRKLVLRCCECWSVLSFTNQPGQNKALTKMTLCCVEEKLFTYRYHYIRWHNDYERALIFYYSAFIRSLFACNITCTSHSTVGHVQILTCERLKTFLKLGANILCNAKF